MTGRTPKDAPAAETRSMRWAFPYLAFSAGFLSLFVGGFLGAALVFGIAATLAWKTGRSNALRWTLTAFAVLCAVGLAIVALDAGTGMATLINTPG